MSRKPMRRQVVVWVLLGLGLGCLSGCAATQYDQGKRLLDRQEYAAAAEALRAALVKEPENVPVLVDLAEALYYQGELDQAKVHLKKVRSLAPGNSEAVLLLGLIHEKQGDIAAAIEAYRSYSEMSRLSKGRQLVKGRLDRLVRERIQQETQKALAQEAALDVAAIPDSALAVVPFRNLGRNAALDPLQKGLAEMMATDLSKVPGLKVVERLQLQEMMKEIGLGMTGAVDSATAPRLGKLLGASRLVNGSYADLAAKQVRLDLSVAGVKSGRVESSGVEGPLDQLFRLQKQLTLGMVEEMGIKLTDEQRDAIQEIPTENMLAFIAYSKGLDLEDQGKPQEAASAFQEAVNLDPNFGLAQEGLERAAEEGVGTVDIQEVEKQVLAKKEGVTAEQTGVNETQERLIATGALTGAGFIPTGSGTPSEGTSREGSGSEVREPVEEQEAPSFGGEETQIEIVVPLPQPGRIEATGRFEEEE